MNHISSVTETTRTWAEQRQLAVVFQSQTGSTNDDAKKAATREGDSSVLYLAAHQTAGRGRGTNTWLDTGNGEGLLSTWSFQISNSPQAITGPRIGLALYRAARSSWPGLPWSLKAPNDLYLDGRKVGGLLVESVSAGDRHRLLVGLGLNVLNHPRRFQQAEHLGQALQNVPSEGEWFQFLDELLSEFNAALTDIVKPGLSDLVCRELTDALNLNSARPFVIQRVSSAGDLIHASGQVRWTDL